jgi:hypothetical protein
MKGGGTFDIDGFLEFRPAQEGEAREKEGKSVKNTICRFCPSLPHPRRRKSLPSEKIFFLSVLFIITALQPSSHNGMSCTPTPA